VQGAKDTVNLPGAGWLDLQRSVALWRDYTATKSLIRRGDWVDPPSENIPALYVMTGYFLSQGLIRDNQRALGDSVLRTTTQVAAAAHLDNLFRPELTTPQAIPMPESGDVPRAAPIPSAVPLAPPPVAPTAPPRPRPSPPLSPQPKPASSR
jgi:hypothetical protein